MNIREVTATFYLWREYVLTLWCGRNKAFPILLSLDDYEWAEAQGLWSITHPNDSTKKQYAYQAKKENGRTVMRWLHKEILERYRGPSPSPIHIIGDHMDGNSFNNQRYNLRWATHSMNSWNRHGRIIKQPYLFPDMV